MFLWISLWLCIALQAVHHAPDVTLMWASHWPSHIWTGRGLVWTQTCSPGLIRMTQMTHSHQSDVQGGSRVALVTLSPQLNLFFFKSFPIFSSYSLNHGFPIFSIMRLLVRTWQVNIESTGKFAGRRVPRCIHTYYLSFHSLTKI